MRQLRGGQLLDRVDSLAGAERRHDDPRDRRRGVQVVARDHHGPGALADVHQRLQGYHLSLVIAHIDQADGRNVLAEASGGLQVDLPVSAEGVEVVHVVGPQIGFQRPVDVLHREPQSLHLGPIDLHVQLRRVGAKLRVDTQKAGFCLDLVDQPFALFLQVRHVGPAAVLDHQLEAAGHADARHGRSAEDIDAGLADLLPSDLRQMGHDRIGVQAGLVPPREFVEHHEHRPEVGTVRAEQHRLPRDGNNMRHSRRAAGDLVQSRHDVAGSLHRRRVRQLHVDQQPALVLHRNETDRIEAEQPARNAEHAKVDQ